MQAVVNPGSISGTITVPASKSMMQRVCAAALLHDGKTIIANPGHSNDDEAALSIIEQMGAEVLYKEDGTIEISGAVLKQPAGEINCGESGLSARLFIPIAALYDSEITVTGEGSLLQRPMTEYIQLLPELGVQLTHENGHLPVNIKGPLAIKDVTINGALSSQFLSGLLITYAFCTTQPVTITVSGLASKPYIDLTLQVLKYYGKQVAHNNYQTFTITPDDTFNEHDIYIHTEGDWSSASALLVAGTIAGDITLQGIDMESTQADKVIVSILEMTGARPEVNGNNIHIKKADRLTAFDYDATDTPDLFPILSILAGCCRGESCIKGIARLIHKESNRLESITDMLSRLGIFYSVDEDCLKIEGGSHKFEYAEIDAYNDHRIVMAAAIAALRAKGPVTIYEAEAVNKSYPDFFAHLSSLGADCMTNL